MVKVRKIKRASAWMETRPPEVIQEKSRTDSSHDYTGKLEISVPPVSTVILETKKMEIETIVDDISRDLQMMDIELIEIRKLYEKYSTKVSNVIKMSTESTELQFSEITTAETITFISKMPEPELKGQIDFCLDGPEDRHSTKLEPCHNIVKMELNVQIVVPVFTQVYETVNRKLANWAPCRTTPNFKFRKKHQIKVSSNGFTRNYFGKRRKKEMKIFVKKNYGFFNKILRNFKKKKKKIFILHVSMDTLEPWTMKINGRKVNQSWMEMMLSITSRVKPKRMELDYSSDSSLEN